jgi:phosphotransferase system  glucose/maltose/N-acetylglucosamine-specific IIC component
MNTLRLLAASIKGDKTNLINNLPTNSADSILNNAINIVYFVSGAVAVIIIIVAGFMFITSGGDPAATAKARNTITYAVVGLVVIALAFVITQFVIGRFHL